MSESELLPAVQQGDLRVARPEPLPLEPSSLSPITILEAAVRGGITAENVAVVKELAAMVREHKADAAKAAFAKSFFELRMAMPIFYADKEVLTKAGAVAFEYCSPQEIKDILEPLMLRNGFVTMTGQELSAGQVTATVTLMHEGGHSELRSYSCRVSPGNELMNPSKCDAAATTNAERHAFIKMFGLRTRKRDDDDARNLGTFITPDQAGELERRVMETESNMPAFLKLAGAQKISEILSGKYDMLDGLLRKKEQRGR